MEMKLIAASIISLAALFGVQHCAMAAVAAGTNNNVAPVGLYAPDRYDGIPEMCLMPMDFGYCRAKVKRYYFDMRRMKCAMFYWGGCAGNINNFKSLDECNKICIDSNYDELNDDDNGNTRNYIEANSNNKNNNKNNNKANYKYYNNNNNNNNNSSNNNNNNNKNDNRRFIDGARTVDKNDNFEDDESDYSSN